MKKTTKMSVLSGMFAALLLFAGHNTALGQGQINFFTYNSNTNYGLVHLSGGTTLATTNFNAVLLGCTTSNGTYTAISPVTTFVMSGGLGTGIINYTPNIAVSGVAAGTSYWYELEVWSASAGTNWVSSYSLAGTTPGDQYGTSGYAMLTLGGGIFPVYQANGFSDLTLTLTQVPEPATLALMGFGGLSLLLFRRKNS